MKLARYMSLNWGLEAIKSGAFKVLRPLDTNDPYEMMGACCGEFAPEVESSFRKAMHMKWMIEFARYGYRPGFPSWGEVEQRVKNYKYFLNKLMLERKTQQLLHRILCFVDLDKINDLSDQLMWGHYGNGGRGVRIWFDADKLDLAYGKVYPVSYSNKRPLVDLGRLKSHEIDASWQGYLREVLFTKSLAWAYEAEQRMLVSHRAFGDVVRVKGNIELVVLPQDAIIRIDFGPTGRIGDTIAAIDELRCIPSLEHVEFYVANFSIDEYRYEYLTYDECLRHYNPRD